MRNASRTATLLGTIGLVLTLAAPLAAAGPEPVGKAFDVKVVNGVVDVTFALALSEVSSYPVTITAICCSTEEVLYEGTLTEGVYRFTAPMRKISGHGELKVVLKTRVQNLSEDRKDDGQGGGRKSSTWLVYKKWQGSM